MNRADLRARIAEYEEYGDTWDRTEIMSLLDDLTTEWKDDDVRVMNLFVCHGCSRTGNEILTEGHAVECPEYV